MAEPHATVDIVTVAWRESRDDLRQHVESLATAWRRLPPERRGRAVVVANGAGSAPDLDAMLEQELDVEVTRIDLERNLGPTRGRNLGFREVGGDYVAAFDADGRLDPTSLERLVAALDGSPSAAFAAARVVRPGDDSPDAPGAEQQEVEWGPAGATLYRAAALRALEGFDPLFAWACEDMDFGYRARAGGWTCLSIPAARFVHESEGRATVRRIRLFTEYVLVWRHVHFSHRVTARSWLAQLPLLLRANPADRRTAAVGGTLGLIAYLRHVPACERRRRR